MYYADGGGIPKYDVEAIRLYQLAADQGNIRALKGNASPVSGTKRTHVTNPELPTFYPRIETLKTR